MVWLQWPTFGAMMISRQKAGALGRPDALDGTIGAEARPSGGCRILQLLCVFPTRFIVVYVLKQRSVIILVQISQVSFFLSHNIIFYLLL